jgi:hypothetical protein
MESQEIQELFKRRGKGKYNITHGIKSITQYYKANWGDLPIEDKMYKEFLREFHENVIRRIVLKGMIYNMPAKLGIIELTFRYPTTIINDDMKIVRTNAPINYKETNKLWAEDPENRLNRKVIYHTNADTGGKIYGIKTTLYRKSSSDFLHAYSLKVVRRIRRELLAPAIKNKEITWL